MDNSLSACPWEPIKNFQSLIEFRRFENWLLDQIKEGRAEEVPVDPDFRGNYGSPRWFKHNGSGQIWLVAGPDGPFHGTFEPLVSSLLERLCYLLGQAGQERWENAINEAVFALREPDFSAGYQKAWATYQGLVKTDDGFASLEIETPAAGQLRALRDKITLLFNCRAAF